MFNTKIVYLKPRLGERYASALTSMSLSNKVYKSFGKIDLKDYLEFVESVTSPESMNISSTKGRLDSLEYGKTPVNIASLLTGGMGLSSETGEFNEIIKKCLFQGKPLDDDTRYHLMRELGDIMWYWVTACRALNYNPNDVIKENIKKLQARYPDKKFDVEKSENRQEGDL